MNGGIVVLAVFGKPFKNYGPFLFLYSRIFRKQMELKFLEMGYQFKNCNLN